MQKRELIKLRESLTGSNKQVIEYEDDIARLTNEATSVQKNRADCSLNVQELVGIRDIQATDSLIATSGLQISLEEVREALAKALATARVQVSVLNDLRQRMRGLNNECREAL